MKFRNSYDPNLYTITAAVHCRTDSSFDNYGQVEQVTEMTVNVRNMLAELINLLAEKEIISGPEVAALVHMTLVIDE